jgi:hypothetical protein
MSKRNRQPKVLPTLELQLKNMPARPKLDPREPWMDYYGAQAQLEWDRRRRELQEAIKYRDAKRLRDPGPDVSGNYDVSPFMLAKGHKAEVADRELRTGPDTSFPRRIATQRTIDRYRARGHIDELEYQAAEMLWRIFVESGASFSVTAGYDPIFIQSSQNTDAIIAKKADAAVLLNSIWRELPWRSRGCVRAVVIEDIPASEWSQKARYSAGQSKAHGLGRLRLGLQRLVELFGLDKVHPA